MHPKVSTPGATEPLPEVEIQLPPAIVWLPSLTTGNTRIDHEHRALIGQCNALTALVADGAGRAEFESALVRLAAGMDRHFETEEAILAATGFERLEAHKREHQRTASQIQEIRDRASRAGTLADRAAITRELRDLLIDVFLHHDLDYKSHLLFSRGKRTHSEADVPAAEPDSPVAAKFGGSEPV